MRHAQLVISAGLAFAVAFGAMAAPTATAHQVSAAFSARWGADPSYGIGHLDGPIDSADGRDAIHYGDNPWDGLSGSWLDFNWSGNENPMVDWTGSSCTTAPSDGLWILSDSISALGVENTCTSSGTIVKSVIRFDDTRSNWYTGSSWTVPAGKYDLRSVSVHEYGHALGMMHYGSMYPPEYQDCSGSDQETMCSGLASGTSYKRSLGTHDVHTAEAGY